ncbi:MAG: DUF2252 domain-containing protein [Thermoplasmata archaeon]|nr:DUF2252 domain-containing protein [Thermoplasmata archaeon]MCI4356598.1 DUF2252 domain-containing protein [Thermoplasmata archaeon]
MTARRSPPHRTGFGQSRAVRAEAGRALRRRIPRSAHGIWTAPPDRPDPVDLLESSSRHRIPGLVPIRYGRMSLSPFAFLRGSASVMAHDLASTPTTGLGVQLSGDAHLGNFGVFATPERDRVFDSNDFDETLPGPFEWDVKRLATSLVVAARQNRLSPAAGPNAALAAARAYRVSLRTLAGESYFDIWYSHIDRANVPDAVDRSGRRLLGEASRRARRETGLYAFPRLTERVHGEFRIRDDPPLIVHYRGTSAKSRAERTVRTYLRTLPVERRALLDRYQVVDVAQKVVGVGSVGTDCSIVLMFGDSDHADPVFLQLKEAVASVYEPYAGASRFASHGERVVVGQRLIQEASDIALGWSSAGGRDYYVRQLRDMKFSSDVATMGAKALLGEAELCGASLARAHARTGDPAAIDGYLGEKSSFEEAVARFAVAYADQTQVDHRALLRAIRRGRVPAKVDV